MFRRLGNVRNISTANLKRPLYMGPFNSKVVYLGNRDPVTINSRKTGNKLRAAVLDWSGTTMDAYVIAPAKVFYDVFEKHNVPITMEEARGPMGLRKDLHIAEILKIPAVRDRWSAEYGRAPIDSDVDNLFTDFVPMQLNCLRDYTTLLPGVAEVTRKLQGEYGIKIGVSTGFTREMVDVLLEQAIQQGFIPDTTVAGDDVLTGWRPTPHMIYKNLDKLGYKHPIHTVLKVDDTVGGIGEGLNAGCYTCGLSRYSNYMNINTLEEEEELSEEELYQRNIESREKLINAGAHYVIDDMRRLPEVVEDINRRLARGERPT